MIRFNRAGRRATPARTAGQLHLCPMTTAHLDSVVAIEVQAYPHPWSRGNFVDSLVAGYHARCLVEADGTVVAYMLAMAGVDEMHLLNISVDPARQGQGHALLVFGAELADGGWSNWPQAVPDGLALAALAQVAWRAGRLLDPALALPLYVRDKVAQTTAERAAARQTSARPAAAEVSP